MSVEQRVKPDIYTFKRNQVNLIFLKRDSSLNMQKGKRSLLTFLITMEMMTKIFISAMVEMRILMALKI